MERRQVRTVGRRDPIRPGRRQDRPSAWEAARGITAACNRLLPTEQRPSSRQHAPAATRRYLHEHPDEPLAIRPTTPTRARKRHREELTPLPEPISHGLDSDAKIDLGDVAALMSEAIAWIGGRPREQQILRVLVVFEDAPHTLAEIAQKFDLSTERIRQIESRGLAILVRQARKPDTPGAVLAALLHLPGPDAPDEAFADRVATIATSESEAPARVAIPFLLCAAVSGMRSVFFMSMCTMWPGLLAIIFCGSRLVPPFGSMNFRRFKPSCASSRVIVRRLTGVPW